MAPPSTSPLGPFPPVPDVPPPMPPGLGGAAAASPDATALVAQLRGEVMAHVESRFAAVAAQVRQETQAVAAREEEAQAQQSQALEAKLRNCLAEMQRLEAENAALQAEAVRCMGAHDAMMANKLPPGLTAAPGFPAVPHFPVPAEAPVYEMFDSSGLNAMAAPWDPPPTAFLQPPLPQSPSGTHQPARGRAQTAPAVPSSPQRKISNHKLTSTPQRSPGLSPGRAAFSLMSCASPTLRASPHVRGSPNLRSSPSVPASPFVILEDGGTVFTFTHRRTDESVDWGLDCNWKDGEDSLIIDGVRAGGAIDAWNRQCAGGPAAGKAVMTGDIIKSVNGEVSPEAMLEQCRTKTLLKFVIERKGSELELAPAAPWESGVQIPMFPGGNA